MTPQIVAKKGRGTSEPVEALLLFHFAGEPLSLGAVSIDRALGGSIGHILKLGEFSGKHLETILLHAPPKGRLAASRILLVGLGERKKFQGDRLRQAVGKGAALLRDAGAKSIAMLLIGANSRPPLPAPREEAQIITEGALLGLYRFGVYKTDGEDRKKQIGRIVLLDPPARSNARRLIELEEGIRIGRIVSDAANFVRDLGNHPSNVVTPSRLAEEAKRIASEFGLRCTVLERDEMEKLGMGALVAVARGTQEPPKFIVLEYRRGGAAAPIVLVGKSITFDSGGISLKSAEKMEHMKCDMAGGATVLGTIAAAAKLGLPLNLVGILPATDNMPSGTAVHPGDVVKTMSGKTVEIINTDAEGRLCLADALTYAARYKPALMIDLATLTSACVVALGHHAIGLMGTAPILIEKVKRSGEATGERVWELPLWDEYREQIKSEVADMKNVGGRPGGSITAGVFLKEFVQNHPWIHLDIAGTSLLEESRPYIPKGASGIGLRLLVHLLSNYSPTGPAANGGRLEKSGSRAGRVRR